ncbi:MAG: ribosome biogenesis GTP-binding protein YihA/YsxC, partial [Coprobacillus sp.]
MYKVNKAEFVLCAAWKSQWPEADLPEICLAGRSNVGKSSMINAITNYGKLAKVSGTPGKTRTLNFFNINDELRLVDVPGYGYAKVNVKIKESFGDMIDTYLSDRET